MTIQLQNTYASDLDGFYVPWKAQASPDPAVVRFNEALAADLGLGAEVREARFLAGLNLPEEATPLAQAYAGHQFGGFSPQLGDGRALLLGEVVDGAGRRFDLHLKGSGRTPFSRGGDGKAVLGPVLREYLMGEAMHALGIPTTRALAALTTGEEVLRDDGMQAGAILVRVASSHLRVGTFQFFAARGETGRVQQLADYAIRRHDPDLADAPDRYLRLLGRVAERQARLVAEWMGVGFIHGVMNTDNMTISGETIDYGPCAFMDQYDPKTVFSSIDQFGRYAYANQPRIAQWNIARFAETLLHLIDEETDRAVERATGIVEAFSGQYETAWLGVMRRKLGLVDEREEDQALAIDLLALMQAGGVDFTSAFRRLARPEAFAELFADDAAIAEWLARFQARTAGDAEGLAERLLAANPAYIPRNHMVEAALTAAKGGDMAPFDALLEVLQQPFNERDDWAGYALPAPSDFGPYKTFCGT